MQFCLPARFAMEIPSWFPMPMKRWPVMEGRGGVGAALKGRPKPAQAPPGLPLWITSYGAVLANLGPTRSLQPLPLVHLATWPKVPHES